MKFKLLLIVFALFAVANTQAQDKLHAYYKVNSSQSMAEIKAAIKVKLRAAGFDYLGGYNVENKANMHVIAFTRKDLSAIALAGKTQRALAGVLKFGIYKKGNATTVSIVNPEYLFYAYFGSNTNSYAKLKKISNEVHAMLKSLGSGFAGFGGQLTKKELKKYHYMFGMPYFSDPIELKEFDSFSQACGVIKKNLELGTANTKKVYILKFNAEKIAIYGVGLTSKSEGEAHFLPIIGEDNLAAMPYEIIVINKTAYMLHGKYRLALSWPKLSMGQFMKISGTPGDIEDTLEALTK